MSRVSHGWGWHRWAWIVCLSGIGFAGCTGPADSDSAEDPNEGGSEAELEGPSRADRETEFNVDPPPSDEDPSEPRLELSRSDDPWGNDGQGAWVRATAQMRFDVRQADGWPGRALDPVLHVGELRLTRYDFIGIDVLRFVLADVAVVPPGAPVALQWGDDETTRVELSDAMTVPQAPPDAVAPTPVQNGTTGTLAP